MRIRLAVIPPDNLGRVHSLVEALRRAVNAGDMDGLDTATEELLSLTSGGQLVDLPEGQWRRFLAETRSRNPAFQSDYLLFGGACTQFFPQAAPTAVVLQLPIDEKEDDDV